MQDCIDQAAERSIRYKNWVQQIHSKVDNYVNETNAGKASPTGLSKAIEDLKASVSQSRLESIERAVQTLENARESTSKAESSCQISESVGKNLNELKEEVVKEKSLLNKRIDALSSQVESNKTAAGTQHRLDNIDVNIKALKEVTKSHSDSIDAIDVGLLKRFQDAPTGPRADSSSSITVDQARRVSATKPSPSDKHSMPWNKPALKQSTSNPSSTSSEPRVGNKRELSTLERQPSQAKKRLRPNAPPKRNRNPNVVDLS